MKIKHFKGSRNRSRNEENYPHCCPVITAVAAVQEVLVEALRSIKHLTPASTRNSCSYSNRRSGTKSEGLISNG